MRALSLTVPGAPVSAERLFAYACGILTQRAYVERFPDEMEPGEQPDLDL